MIREFESQTQTKMNTYWTYEQRESKGTNSHYL